MVPNHQFRIGCCCWSLCNWCYRGKVLSAHSTPHIFFTPPSTVFNRRHHDVNASSSTGERAWEFFKNDPFFACYICFFVGMMVVLCLSISMGAGCNSSLGNALVIISVLILVYLGVGLCILLSWVAMEALEEMSTNCCLWLLPCLWPCLVMGCLFGMWESESVLSLFFSLAWWWVCTDSILLAILSPLKVVFCALLSTRQSI